MGVTVVARFGLSPHPSMAAVDVEWLKDQLGLPEKPGTGLEYVRVASAGRSLGVLRLLDTRLNTQEDIYLHPGAWLRRGAPEPGTRVEIEAVDERAYTDWRKHHTRLRKYLVVGALVLTAAAGLVEAAWSAGRYWDWWHPSEFWAGFSHVAKWAMLAVGVGVIAAWKEYLTLD